MRKSIAFFGGALFVVLSLSIYLVVDQMSRMPSYESIIEAQVMLCYLVLVEEMKTLLLALYTKVNSNNKIENSSLLISSSLCLSNFIPATKVYSKV